MMLGMWKRTWKEKDNMLDGPSNSASSLDASEAVHPSDAISSSLPLGSTGSKRARINHQEPYVEATPKRIKLCPQEPFGRPPEADSSLHNLVLEQAKKENTIVILPTTRLTAVEIIIQFLIWAAANERSLPKDGHRIALLVVNDLSSIDMYGASILAENPHLQLGKYNEQVHKSEASSWIKLLERDIVITTPSLLLDLFMQETLTITQLHSLIFCDVQNIQNHTSIIRVMNDFYRIKDSLCRPRILTFIMLTDGSTGFQLESALVSIENILDSKVINVQMEGHQEIPVSQEDPHETVILYGKSTHPATTLLGKLRQFGSLETPFRKHFEASQDILAELGSFASDLIWQCAMKEIETDSVTHEKQGVKAYSISHIRHYIKDYMKNRAYTMLDLDPSSRGFNVTHKFLTLVETLKACEPYGQAFRGIIFVQQQVTASAIVDLLRFPELQLGFLHPYALDDTLFENLSYQSEIFHNFTTGAHNLLIASKSAEKLDMPEASVVICFDIFESQAFNTYVRARAPGREKHLIYMVERGNHNETRILSHTHPHSGVIRWTETISAEYASPPLAVRGATNSNSEDDDGTFIQDPTTSRRIYPRDSPGVIYQFALKMAHKTGRVGAEQALFEFEGKENEFGVLDMYTCTTLLPEIPRITGPALASKEHAVRAACYKLCEQLAGAGLLHYRLYPQPPRVITDDTSSSWNGSYGYQSGTRIYHRKEPDFWNNTRQTPITSLHPIILSINHTDENMEPHSPFTILTRQPLPDLSSFKLFISGVPATVNIRRGAMLQVDGDRLRDLHLYTLRVCRAITNKPYDCTMADMVYFLAPLISSWTTHSNEDAINAPRSSSHIADYISWDLIALAGRNYTVPLKVTTSGEAEEEIQDAIIQDRRVEFTRRYVALRMRHDLTPLSKPPDSPRESNYDNLLEYCKARLKGFEGLQNSEQPLIEVSAVPTVLNRLNPTSRPPMPTKFHAKYLIPEFCVKFTIPASTLRTALLLPSITRRIDDFLLVKELNAKIFDDAISEDLLHIALCTPSSGVEYDYERLELLGDAFLKYLSTIYVFVTNPDSTEGALHTARQLLISNKSLFQNAQRIGLAVYIQSKPFAPRFWHPPNFILLPLKHVDSEVLNAEGENTNLYSMDATIETSSTAHIDDSMSMGSRKKKKRRPGEDAQWLGDKAIADVAEAIIGAAYITGGSEIGLKVTKAMGVPISGINEWSDFEYEIVPPLPKVLPKLKPGSLDTIEAIIGHKIKRPHLLVQALTHSSIPYMGSISYERLEFIGDAILDFLVIRHLFDHDQQLSPGGLTLLKGAMVSNSALAAACVWSGLHEHLLYESYTLAKSIQDYILKLQICQAEEYKAAEIEGRPRGQYWSSLDPPKALSDVVESITGAIYISDNFSPIGAESLFNNLLKPFYDKHITLKTLSHHPTKILFELLQAQGCQRFKILKEKNDRMTTTCQVLVHDIILTSAEDPIATMAARRASLTALDALEGDVGFLARTCNCRSDSQPTQKEQEEARQMLELEEEERDDLCIRNKSVEVPGKQFTFESELEDGMILE